jgi:hypothetical protein
MRGKKARKFRRWAQRITPGVPDVSYGRSQHTGAVVLERCTRLVYQNLKERWKAEKKDVPGLGPEYS